MSEMIERAALKVRVKMMDAFGYEMSKDESITLVRAAIEAMRDYRGEVEEALDRVPGGWGRGAWLEGINAALGVQS